MKTQDRAATRFEPLDMASLLAGPLSCQGVSGSWLLRCSSPAARGCAGYWLGIGSMTILLIVVGVGVVGVVSPRRRASCRDLGPRRVRAIAVRLDCFGRSVPRVFEFVDWSEN